MFIVFRHAPDIPPEKRAPHMEGRWIEHDPYHIGHRRDWPASEVLAVAEPVTPLRYEYRDDGERAQVWEIRLTDAASGGWGGHVHP